MRDLRAELNRTLASINMYEDYKQQHKTKDQRPARLKRVEKFYDAPESKFFGGVIVF